MSKSDLPVYAPAKRYGSVVGAGFLFSLAAVIAFATWVAWPFVGITPFALAAACVAGGVFLLAPDADNVQDANAPPPLPRSSALTPDQWFWVILAAVVLAVAGATSFEDNRIAGLGSFGALVIGVVMVNTFARKNVLTFVKERWGKVLILIVAYLAIGSGYSFFRYDIYASDWRKAYDAAYARHVQTQKGDAKQDFRTKIWSDGGYSQRWLAAKPSYENDSGRIKRWIVFWPWSAAHFLLSDFIVRSIDWLTSQLSGVYNFISDRHTKDLKE